MNISKLDTVVYNQGSALSAVSLGSIHFGGYSLMTACTDTVGVAIQNMNPYDLVAELDSYESSIADGGGVINKRYPTKSINLSLYIQGSSQSDLIARIDDLKKNTQNIEKDFGILVAGEYRTYRATVRSISIPSFRRYDTHISDVEMELLITSPFWVKNAITETRLGITGNLSAFIQNQGNRVTDPILIYVFLSGTSVSAINIETKIASEPTGYAISVVSAFVAGDVLVLDYGKKTCQKNGVTVNFSWVMRPLFDGANIVATTFTGTSVMDFSLIYSPTFL